MGCHCGCGSTGKCLRKLKNGCARVEEKHMKVESEPSTVPEKCEKPKREHWDKNCKTKKFHVPVVKKDEEVTWAPLCRELTQQWVVTKVKREDNKEIHPCTNVHGTPHKHGDHDKHAHHRHDHDEHDHVHHEPEDNGRDCDCKPFGRTWKFGSRIPRSLRGCCGPRLLRQWFMNQEREDNGGYSLQDGMFNGPGGYYTADLVFVAKNPVIYTGNGGMPNGGNDTGYSMRYDQGYRNHNQKSRSMNGTIEYAGGYPNPYMYDNTGYAGQRVYDDTGYAGQQVYENPGYASGYAGQQVYDNPGYASGYAGQQVYDNPGYAGQQVYDNPAGPQVYDNPGYPQVYDNAGYANPGGYNPNGRYVVGGMSTGRYVGGVWVPGKTVAGVAYGGGPQT